jgi:antitoxin MazE
MYLHCIYIRRRLKMISRVQKWGNSLALRIPGAFAREIGLKNETSVELKQVEGTLVITPLAEPDMTLDELLASVNKENMHGEVDTGYAMGNEIW